MLLVAITKCPYFVYHSVPLQESSVSDGRHLSGKPAYPTSSEEDLLGARLWFVRTKCLANGQNQEIPSLVGRGSRNEGTSSMWAGLLMIEEFLCWEGRGLCLHLHVTWCSGARLPRVQMPALPFTG